MGKTKVNKKTNNVDQQKEEIVVMSVETEMSPERIAQEQENLESQDLHDPDVEKAKKAVKAAFNAEEESSDKEENTMAEEKKTNKDVPYIEIDNELEGAFNRKFPGINLKDPKVQEKLHAIAESVKKNDGDAENAESFALVKKWFPRIITIAAIAALGYFAYRMFFKSDEAPETDAGAIGEGMMQLVTGIA